MSQAIAVDLPARATILELAMTSPTEGWLVGAVFAPDHRTVQSGLIMRYHDQEWRPVDDPLPVAFIDGIAMVSADEGWVTGRTQSKTQSYLLRYTGGHWHPVEVPFQPTGGSHYGGIRMHSADEGWIVVHPEYGWKGQIESLLLHYRHGAWTPVTVPVPLVYDCAPVGPDELWLVGNDTVRNRQDSTLAHYQHGRWTTQPVPVALHDLRMSSPAAGYAIGTQPEPAHWPGHAPPPAAVWQYDGTVWHAIDSGADPAAQLITLCDESDGWAFVRTPTATHPVNAVITAAQHRVGPQWQAVPWPFPDLLSVSALVRAAPGEYWAAGFCETLSGRQEGSFWELLHFSGGQWTEYPPR